MKKDCIKLFMSAWKTYDSPDDPRVPNWAHRFHDAGYFQVVCPADKREDANVWCSINIGADHYACMGHLGLYSDFTFWFETSEDAVLFALKWS